MIHRFRNNLGESRDARTRLLRFLGTSRASVPDGRSPGTRGPSCRLRGVPPRSRRGARLRESSGGRTLPNITMRPPESHPMCPPPISSGRGLGKGAMEVRTSKPLVVEALRAHHTRGGAVMPERGNANRAKQGLALGNRRCPPGSTRDVVPSRALTVGMAEPHGSFHDGITPRCQWPMVMVFATGAHGNSSSPDRVGWWRTLWGRLVRCHRPLGRSPTAAFLQGTMGGLTGAVRRRWLRWVPVRGSEDRGHGGCRARAVCGSSCGVGDRPICDGAMGLRQPVGWCRVRDLTHTVRGRAAEEGGLEQPVPAEAPRRMTFMRFPCGAKIGA